MKAKATDYIPLYNNMAKARGIGIIPEGTKMTINEIADKIEWVNKFEFLHVKRKRAQEEKAKRAIEYKALRIKLEGMTFWQRVQYEAKTFIKKRVDIPIKTR